METGYRELQEMLRKWLKGSKYGYQDCDLLSALNLIQGESRMVIKMASYLA